MAVAVTPEQAADKIRTAASGADPDALSRVFIKRARLACLADVRENFDKSHGPDGQAWKPLAFPRPNSKGSDKPLLNNGILRASVTGTGQGHVEEITDHSLTIGTNLPYARLQQEGGTITPKSGKALALPLTKEATRYKPRDFPRPLFVAWRKGAKSGVLAERPKFVKQSKGEKAAGKRFKRQSKRIADLQTKLRLYGQRYKKSKPGSRSRARAVANLVKTRLKLKLLRSQLSETGAKRLKLRTQRGVANKIKAVYALVRSVTVPARPFLGFGRRLITRLDDIAIRVFGKALFGSGGGSDGG